MRRRGVIWIGLLLLTGCAGAPQPAARDDASAEIRPVSAGAMLRPYPETGKFLECVPFARAVSGIDLHGDAWTWWAGAAGRYERGNRPEVGAVLVLQRSDRVPLGHVSVVAAIQDARHLLVTHANWGADGNTRGVVHERMPIVDVSAANDWTEIRLMNIKGTLGRVYRAHGFIYPRALQANAG